MERISAKKTELDRMRPLSPGSLQALSTWYDVELTYTSNAIEGNTLTRNETAVVLEKGITVSGKPLKDHLEAIGHKDALDYIRALAQTTEPVREIDIRQIHRLIMLRVNPEEAGQYSRHQRLIAGSSLVLPSPAEIPPLMGDLAQWLQTTPLNPATAFAAHERLVAIHPFSDGNGRTGRLLMNLLLLKNGYPPTIIGPEHRVRYLDSLQSLQENGNRQLYNDFMAERLEESLSKHLEMLSRGLDR